MSILTIASSSLADVDDKWLVSFDLIIFFFFNDMDAKWHVCCDWVVYDSRQCGCKIVCQF